MPTYFVVGVAHLKLCSNNVSITNKNKMEDGSSPFWFHYISSRDKYKKLEFVLLLFQKQIV